MAFYIRKSKIASLKASMMLIMQEIMIHDDQLLGTCLNGAVSWCSKRQPTIALSTTQAEYRAMAMATQENMWIKQLMKDLHQEINHAATLYCDNLSVVRLAENLVFHARTKHVEVYYHFIREKVLQEEIEMKPIKTENQITDIFTKGLPTTKHAKFEQLWMIERSRIISVEGEY